LLVDGSNTAATDVVGAVKVIVVTVVVVDDTMITVEVADGALTVTGVVASLHIEVAAKTVDVAAVTTSVVVVSDATSASYVVLNLDGAEVETTEDEGVSSSEMTTVSGKSNSISGRVGVVVAGVIDV